MQQPPKTVPEWAAQGEPGGTAGSRSGQGEFAPEAPAGKASGAAGAGDDSGGEGLVGLYVLGIRGAGGVHPRLLRGPGGRRRLFG
jgi:hypothetical protein